MPMFNSIQFILFLQHKNKNDTSIQFSRGLPEAYKCATNNTGRDPKLGRDY